MDDMGMEVAIDSFIRQNKEEFEKILVRKGYIKNPLIDFANGLKIYAEKLEQKVIEGTNAD